MADHGKETDQTDWVWGIVWLELLMGEGAGEFILFILWS